MSLLKSSQPLLTPPQKVTTVEVVNLGESETAFHRDIQIGITLIEIIGPIDIEKTKAVVIGTRLYDPSILERIIDEEFPFETGAITVFDKNSCLVSEAEKAMLSVRKECCGFCTFCREGSIQIHTMLKDITSGIGKTSDISMIKEIGEAMKFSSICGIGQTGAIFILDVLENFAEEVDAHIRRKRCPAESCTAFMNIYINPVTCTGCGDCIEVCPVDCIEGKSGFIHMIDEFDCTKCGKCIDACQDGAVIKTTGRQPKLPERLTRVGRFKQR
jgi:ferredoxin